MNAYTIHDAKAEHHNTPFFQPNDAYAMRTFANMVNGTHPDNLLAQSPSDFTLFKIGEFDEATGVLLGFDKQSLANGKDVQKQGQ